MARESRDMRSKGVENSIEGKGRVIKGRAKDALGGATGDSSMQARGKMDQLKGKVQDAVGKAQRKRDR